MHCRCGIAHTEARTEVGSDTRKFALRVRVQRVAQRDRARWQPATRSGAACALSRGQQRRIPRAQQEAS